MHAKVTQKYICQSSPFNISLMYSQYPKICLTALAIKASLSLALHGAGCCSMTALTYRRARMPGPTLLLHIHTMYAMQSAWNNFVHR